MLQERLFELSTTSKKSLQDVDNSERQRALEGLPHYWKLPWPWTDVIVADCGVHSFRTRVDWLEDPVQLVITECHYKNLGLCPGEVKNG